MRDARPSSSEVNIFSRGEADDISPTSRGRHGGAVWAGAINDDVPQVRSSLS
jgi:hypothetical protein